MCVCFPTRNNASMASGVMYFCKIFTESVEYLGQLDNNSHRSQDGFTVGNIFGIFTSDKCSLYSILNCLYVLYESVSGTYRRGVYMFLGLFHQYSVISTPSVYPLLMYSTGVSCTLDIAPSVMGVDIYGVSIVE